MRGGGRHRWQATTLAYPSFRNRECYITLPDNIILPQFQKCRLITNTSVTLTAKIDTPVVKSSFSTYFFFCWLAHCLHNLTNSALSNAGCSFANLHSCGPLGNILHSTCACLHRSVQGFPLPVMIASPTRWCRGTAHSGGGGGR